MARNVKKSTGRAVERAPRTRVSAKHQVTIPMEAFLTAGLQTGDRLRAEAIGPGRVVLSRQDELMDEFSGALGTGGELRRQVETLRGEWD